MRIPERLRLTARRFGPREAAVHGGERISWERLDLVADRVAAGLAGLGVRGGDYVALQMPNSVAYLAAYYGCLRAGATAVPLNPRYTPREVAYALADCGAVATVAASPLLPMMAALRSHLPKLRHIVSGDAAPGGEAAGPEAAGQAGDAGGDQPWVTARMQEWIVIPPAADRPPALDGDRPDSDPATCLYTAGTTGRPKGVLMTHRGLLWDIDAALQVYDADERDRFLGVLPLFHSYAQLACILATLTTGAALVLLSQFRPDLVLDTIAREQVTIFPGVPAHFVAILAAARDARHDDLHTLRLAVTGGAPMPVPVLQAMTERYGVGVLEGYGPTEAGPVVFMNPEKGDRKPGSVGLPLPGLDTKLVDPQDREVPVGEVGEVLVRGENVMAGYLNQPEATAAVLAGGWLHTGDLGRLDADGYLFLVDRKTDLIIVAGLNVYPREVEEVILAHPGVLECAVVGVPDARRGETVAAFVVRREGVAADAADIQRHCRGRLAPYKRPRYVWFRDTLAKNAAGKVPKGPLREEAAVALAAARTALGSVPGADVDDSDLEPETGG